MKKTLKLYIKIVFIAIVLDQVSKILIHKYLNMGANGHIKVIGNWLKIYYTLNPGMAFGLKFGFKYGKLFLTLGRIFASFFILFYIINEANKESRSYSIKLISWSLILGGAIGNVIDSTFYGIIFDNAPYGSPMRLFHGQVIDMIFFDLFIYYFPSWIPFIGGSYFHCFPIFKLADTFISCGIFLIIIKNYFSKR